MSSTPIICGVTCACAPVKPSEVTCEAKSSCSYAAGGKCSCINGVCGASSAKKNCAKAIAGTCSCNGACQVQEAARESCKSRDSCSCGPGECQKVNVA